METNYICVIGSLNYDFFLKINRTPKNGETMHAKAVRFSCGGKGANQAYQMGKLGLNVYMIGCVGNDTYGDQSIQSLESANVNTSGIKRVQTNTGLGFITVGNNGDVSAIIDEGANALVDIKMIKEQYDLIFNSKIIVLQMEIPINTIEYIINEAEKNNVKIVLNPAPAQKISEEVLNKVDYLIVNEVEAEYYLDVHVDEEQLLERIIDLRKRVKCGIVLTLGSKGSYYVNKEKTHIPIIKTKAVDATGAGDSYIGSFVYGIFNGYSEIEACRFGAISGAKTVETYGRYSMPSQL
ncbi:ribokinase [Mycoplasmatota bacterium WC30]